MNGVDEASDATAATHEMEQSVSSTLLEPLDVAAEALKRAEGLEIVVARPRLFEGRQEEQASDALPPPELDARLVTEYISELDAFVSTGHVRGTKAIEEVRFARAGGHLYILRDVYIDPDTVPTMVGRGLPVHLGSTEEVVRDRVSAMATSSATASSPVITSLSGVTKSASDVADGVIKTTCGAYNGARVINDLPGVFLWTVNGRGFGAAKGVVKLNGSAVPIKSWSSSAIVLDPTLPWSSPPQSATILELTTTDGKLARWYVSVASAIRTRVAGQCTYGVARKRLDYGLQPSTTAYGAYSQFSGDYVPKKGDQYQWSGKHTAIVSKVVSKVSSSDGTVTYNIEMFEMNYNCRGSTATTTTKFVVRAGKVMSTPVSRAYAGEQASSWYR